jgi:hypothetical protein
MRFLALFGFLGGEAAMVVYSARPIKMAEGRSKMHERSRIASIADSPRECGERPKKCNLQLTCEFLPS